MLLTLVVTVVFFILAVVCAFREERKRFDAQRRAEGKLTFEQLRTVAGTLALAHAGHITLEEALTHLRLANITITMEVDGEQVPIEEVLRLDV